MSVRVMALVWELNIPAFEKLVLLALADCANDDGLAWPSIGTLSRKTGAAERTVQRAIRAIEAAGYLERREVRGKGCHYQVNPRQSDTPVRVTPPSERHPTPVTVSPHPRQSDTQSVNEPSRTVNGDADASLARGARSKRAKSDQPKEDPFPKPDWADAQIWTDFLTNRKRKRCPNTASAYAKFLTDIERIADAEWPPGRLLEHAAAKGWAGIYDPRGNENGRSTANRNGAGGDYRGPDRRSGLARACDAELGIGFPAEPSGPAGRPDARAGQGDRQRAAAGPSRLL